MDLVKRLRTQPPRLGPSASTDILRDEAADKIEQLEREVLDRGKVEYALRNKVEQLTKALGTIAEAYEVHEGHSHCGLGFDSDALTAARAAIRP